MNYFIIIFFLFFCVCYLKYKSPKKEKFVQEINYVRRPISITKPKKCKTYKPRIYGRPNKCFSCEKEIMTKAGPKYMYKAFPTKCFSCEKQSKHPYSTGPTKCFSCN